MVKRKLATRAFAALLAGTLLLSACSPGEEDPTEGSTTKTTTTTTTTEANTEPSTDEKETEAPTETEGTEAPATEATDESEDETETETEPTESSADPVDESDLLESPNYEPEAPVTINYAGWENDLNFAIVREKFQERHPNIKVERFESNFVDEPELTRLAAAGELPDIISINNIGLSARNGWLIDLKERFDEDPIASKVSYQNIIDSLMIMDRLYALPTTIFLGGLVVNTDLLSDLNIPIPEYTWTVSDMDKILHDATVRGESIGSPNAPYIYDWMPGNYHGDKLGRFFFDEETKRFRMDETWEELVNYHNEVVHAEVTLWEHVDKFGLPWEMEEGSDEQKRSEEERAAAQIEFYGSTDHPWDIGRAAMMNIETHMTGWLYNIPQWTGFEYDFYPYPMADGEDRDYIRPGLVTDLAGITTSAKDVDAAWEYLKYITFETVGYTDRLDMLYAYDKDEYVEKFGFNEEVAAGLPEDPGELYQTQGPHMNMVPPQKTQTAIDAFKAFHPLGSPDANPGTYYQLDYIEYGYLDLHRNQPGFNDAFGFIFDNMWNQTTWGDKSPADIAKEVEDGANRILDEWNDAIEEAIRIQEEGN